MIGSTPLYAHLLVALTWWADPTSGPDDLERLRTTVELLAQAGDDASLTPQARTELVELYRQALDKTDRVAGRMRLELTLGWVDNELRLDPRGRSPEVVEAMQTRMTEVAPYLDEAALQQAETHARLTAALSALAPPRAPADPIDVSPSSSPAEPLPLADEAPPPVSPPGHDAGLRRRHDGWVAMVSTGSIATAAGVGMVIFGSLGEVLALRLVGDDPDPRQQEWLENTVPRQRAGYIGGGVAAIAVGATLLGLSLRKLPPRTRVSAMVAPNAAGAVMTGRF